MTLGKTLFSWFTLNVVTIIYQLVVHGTDQGIKVSVRGGIIYWTSNAPINVDIIYWTLVMALLLWYQNRKKEA